MLSPPRKFRMIVPNLTISGPLESGNVGFLKSAGCRKIVTVGGGFIGPEVVAQVKTNHMEASHYSFTPFDKTDEVESAIKRIFNYVVNNLKSGSRVHIAGDVSLIDVATLIGCFRKMLEWNTGYAIAEAIDISDSVEIADMINIITDFDAREWSRKLTYEETR